MANPILTLSGITKTFPGVVALDEVSFDVRRRTHRRLRKLCADAVTTSGPATVLSAGALIAWRMRSITCWAS